MITSVAITLSSVESETEALRLNPLLGEYAQITDCRNTLRIAGICKLMLLDK